MRQDMYYEELEKTYVGKVYEAYVGSVLEQMTFNVLYTGFMFGKCDHGVDLVAIMNNMVYFIQCKNWNKPITLDVIYKIYGIKSELEGILHADYELHAAVYCTKEPYDDVRQCANELGVEINVLKCTWQSFDESSQKYAQTNQDFKTAIYEFITNTCPIDKIRTVTGKKLYRSTEIARNLDKAFYVLASVENKQETIQRKMDTVEENGHTIQQDIADIKQQLNQIHKEQKSINDSLFTIKRMIGDKKDVWATIGAVLFMALLVICTTYYIFN